MMNACKNQKVFLRVQSVVLFFKKSPFSMLLTGALFVGLTIGWTGCSDNGNSANRHQLNISMPEVDGKQIEVNGGVVAPIERIQWEWGDGRVDKHHFFPATHVYGNPGQYEIKVTVFDSKNRTSTKSVTVQIE